MQSNLFKVESSQLFSKSKIWEINRDFYQFRGISAFSDAIVPHYLTSNSFVGKTYAELLLGFLKDLAVKGKTKETVYILELGAGHGRLAFHILTHLQKLIQETNLALPPFCYVLSDIVEENLSFFHQHPQFKTFYEQGILDVSYFDAIESDNLYLRNAKMLIRPQDLEQPIIAIANYFFDSIPNELFLVKEQELSACSISLESNENPAALNPEELIKNLSLTYRNSPLDIPLYKNPIVNEVLEAYQQLTSDTYLFFPAQGMQCIENIKQLSTAGLLLLTMDKGFHEIGELENQKKPDMVTHGSFSIWVNYHALGTFCEKQGGTISFPSSSTFHLELGALLFLEDGASYAQTTGAYQKFVNHFGPDDFNSLKHFSYANADMLQVKELIALFRLSAYDSSFFINFFPRLKQVAKAVTFKERKRIAETMHHVWRMYFSINEKFDLPYALAGIFYDLGFYTDALNYFQHSINLHGPKPDAYYNIALSYYQLRQDKLFFETVTKAKAAFPDYELLKNLEQLDMS